MLKQILDFSKQLLSLTHDTQQNKADIKELQQELKETRQEIIELRREFADLTHIVERLATELRHDRENTAKDHENLLLRLENTLLRHEKGTPLSGSQKRLPQQENLFLPAGVSSAPNAEQFKSALARIFQEAQAQQLPHIDVIAGDLHRTVGGYPGQNHRMPICCSVMEQAIKSGDTIIASPPKGKGASLHIRYLLPRDA